MLSRRVVLSLFCRLYQAFGPQGWWPAQTLTEMALGAILTQGVSWNNARLALDNLREKDLLELNRLLDTPLADLARLIYPAGYYNAKARKLHAFSAAVALEPEGLPGLLSQPTNRGRRALLSIWGIGPETADSILLYGGNHPVLVVDAYTHRILRRHGWAPDSFHYGRLQSALESNLPRDVHLFQELHALLVKVARDFCTGRQKCCSGCPLQLWPQEPAE